MTRSIYRQEALERLGSPEQLDRLLQLTSPRGWIALVALGMLLTGALAWSILGTVPITVEGQGVLTRGDGPVRLEAPAAGVVQEVRVEPGDAVAGDQVLALLMPDGSGKPLSVRSPGPARVLGRFIHCGSRVKTGDLLLLLEPGDQPMQALVYLPVEEGYQVERGMRALVAPTPARKSEFGYLRGRVLSAARFPNGREDVQRSLENEEMARQLTAAGPVLPVRVELTPAATPSGYAWTSGTGWPTELYSGMPCRVLITVGEERPIELVIPALGRLLGF
jgi:multidrug efflux pump subunit AcrA (membrane-fusion protein)